MSSVRRRARPRVLRRVLWPLALTVAIGGLALMRSPIRPVAWHPPSAPYVIESCAPGSALSSLELLDLSDGHGPESIIAGPDGRLYTGLKGGRIVRFAPDGSSMSTFADTGGRPNGMAFDSSGNLLVADSYKGLVEVGPGVALNADRMGWVDWLQPHPWFKALLAALVGPIFPDTDARWIGSGAFLLAIDLAGNVVHCLRDTERRYVTSTGVLEHGASLYVGSVVEDSVARILAHFPARS